MRPWGRLLLMSLVAVVLAAGFGTRLRPLTYLRPKALCPVNDVPLLDLALGQAAAVTPETAVNAHALHEQVAAHLEATRVHLSVELPRPLGTAGALGKLRDWIAGRDVLVLNADAWRTGDLAGFVNGWDGERVRLLTVKDEARPDFGDRRYAGAALMPWRAVSALQPTPSGLHEVCWRSEPDLDLAHHEGEFVDCGAPSDYLAANLKANQGHSVVGHGAAVAGELVRSVVWPGGRVHAGERLVEAVRVGEALTVPCGIRDLS